MNESALSAIAMVRAFRNADLAGLACLVDEDSVFNLLTLADVLLVQQPRSLILILTVR